MILRSGKDDIISTLPDELLLLILSLLPYADAYRTGILSNRWKHLWAFLPFIRLVMPSCSLQEEANQFLDFVDKTLAFRGGINNMPIQNLFLSISCISDYNRVLDLVHGVVSSKFLQILELKFPTYNYIRLRWELFKTCNNTLVELNLEGIQMVDVLPATGLLFPFLKKLNLKFVVHPNDQSLQDLLSACPILQELCLEEQMICYQRKYKISSPSLKRLKIHGDFLALWVVIDAPKLEYFEDYGDTFYSLANPSSSLVEAHISKSSYYSVIQFLTLVSSARILTLTGASLLALNEMPGLNLPVFPNLVNLNVDIDRISDWELLFILLNSMPNLQRLTISYGNFLKRRWNPPMEAPACLRFMVKEIVILNREAVKLEDHLTLIRYLLNHSDVLETLTLNIHDIDHERHEKLLNIHRRSKLCRVEFV